MATHRPDVIEQQLPWDVQWRLAFLAGSSGMLFGVDLGCIGGAILGMQQQLQVANWQLGLVVAAAKGAACVGCLLSSALMTVNGRLRTMSFAVLPFLVGPLIIYCSTGVVTVFLGRSLLGIGIGLASVACPRYLGEVALPAYRGELVSLYEMAIAMGFLLASLSVLAVESMSPCWFGCWRYQAGAVPLIFALPLAASVRLLPESPRWLLSDMSRDPADRFRSALEAMVRVGRADAADRLRRADDAAGKGGADRPEPVEPSKDDLVALWDEKHKAAGCPLWRPEPSSREGEEPSEMTDGGSRRRGQRSIGACCSAEMSALKVSSKDAYDLMVGASHVPLGASRALALSMAAATLDQICASTSVLVYAQELLNGTGVVSRQLQDSLGILVSLAKVAGCVAGRALIDQVDRKQLLGWGGASCACWLSLLAVGNATGSPAAVLCGACGFMLSYFGSWGVGFWAVATELTGAFGPPYGNTGQSVATAMMFLSGWATDATFLNVMQAGKWGLCVYAVSGVFMALFAFKVLPETRGITLEECAARVVEQDGFCYASAESVTSDASTESSADDGSVS